MIYLLAGHAVINGKGTGAFGIGDFDEAVEALKLRNDITARLKAKGVPVTNEMPTDALSTVVRWLKSKVTKGDAVYEIHFNAHTNPTATGVECYVNDVPTYESTVKAGHIARTISRVLGLKTRGVGGVKRESESQHAKLAILSMPRAAVKVLIEACFITNPGNVEMYHKNYGLLVEALAEVIGE